jgi:SIR2-like domain
MDFPQELIDAQRDGELVVFAGSGVSMGPPADYPNFECLATKIAYGTRYTREKDEPIDRFLGRLEAEGVSVQRLTQDLLNSPTSKPNPLHGALIRLFRRSPALRLVTTNFDSHFSTEAKRLLGTETRTFYAPALPVGSRFQGLAYIHGSVDALTERMILTDADFGRAYLTEGWTRRFLLDLYARFVVLFVGYSHDDPVMRYLARGLTSISTHRLYALSEESKKSHWDFLGITPVMYPLGKEPDEHHTLREAVEAWADRASMGAYEHQGLIRSILSGTPPIVASEEDDYVRSIVEDEDRIHFFTDNAKDTKWLLWAEERGLLAPLFSRRTEDTKRVRRLGYWFTRNHVVGNPEQALGVFMRQERQLLSPGLWRQIASALFGAAVPTPTSLRLWLPILLDQATPEDDPRLLEHIIENAAQTEHLSLVLRLLEFLIRPRLQFSRSFSFLDGGNNDTGPARGEVKIFGSYHGLLHALDTVLKPNLSEVAEDLARLSAHSIRTAHDLEVLLGSANFETDRMSLGRSAVEAHPQDDVHYDFHIVIDACRNSLEWLIHSRREIARAHIKEWISSSVPLLRRMAVHGVRMDKRTSSEQKLKWLMKHNLLDSIGVHHEMFQLLKAAYSTAAKAERKTFLDQARAVSQKRIREHADEDPGRFLHRLFTLYWWLDDAADGKCAMVRGRLRRLQKGHPEWDISEHPDLTSWSSAGFREIESPISVDDLKSKPIRDAVRFLVIYKEEGIRGPARGGLLNVLSTAVSQDPDWGMRIAKEVLKRRRHHPDIWNRLFWGWVEAELADENWNVVLNMIDQTPQLMECAHDVTRLLERGIQKKEHPLPYSLLPLAENIAHRLWARETLLTKSQEEDSTDWFTTAINQTGGDLVMFFLTAVSLRKQHAGGQWEGVPDGLMRQLQMIVDEKSYAADMGRVVLASELSFLDTTIPSWTRTHIIPLLSWEREQTHAIQAWHGYLSHGKWHDDYLPELLPLYEASFEHLASDLQDQHENFVGHVASICMFSTEEVARNTWLDKFLQSVSPTTRTEFARATLRLLANMDPNKAASTWDKWLETYWDRRATGRPLPLDTAEASKMLEWTLHLGSAFPKVVQKIVETKLGLSVEAFFWYTLAETQIPGTYPKATAELFSHLVFSSCDPVDDFEFSGKVLDQLVEYPETHALLRTAIEHMVGRGVAHVAKYRCLISS